MPGKEEIYMLYVLDYFDEQIVSDIRNYGDFLQSKGCELLFNPAIDWIITAALTDFRKYMFEQAINHGANRYN